MKKTGIWMLILMLLCSAAYALPQPTEDFYVLDEADVLSEETEGIIVLNNDRLYDACGAQIVVVTVDTTGETELEDYAYELFNEWGIGSAKENNGVLVLLVIEDDTYYVMQGSGLEDILPSSSLAMLNLTYLEPHFAEKEYDAGALALFEQLLMRLSAAYGADVALDEEAYDRYIESLEAQEEELASQEEEESRGLGPFGTLVIILLLIFLFSRRSSSGRRGGGSIWPMIFMGRHISRSSGRSTNRTSSRSGSSFGSRSSFGGRSGFGGGRSGGGGGSRGGGAGRGR